MSKSIITTEILTVEEYLEVYPADENVEEDIIVGAINDATITLDSVCGGMIEKVWKITDEKDPLFRTEKEHNLIKKAHAIQAHEGVSRNLDYTQGSESYTSGSNNHNETRNLPNVVADEIIYQLLAQARVYNPNITTDTKIGKDCGFDLYNPSCDPADIFLTLKTADNRYIFQQVDKTIYGDKILGYDENGRWRVWKKEDIQDPNAFVLVEHAGGDFGLWRFRNRAGQGVGYIESNKWTNTATLYDRADETSRHLTFRTTRFNWNNGTGQEDRVWELPIFSQHNTGTLALLEDIPDELEKILIFNPTEHPQQGTPVRDFMYNGHYFIIQGGGGGVVYFADIVGNWDDNDSLRVKFNSIDTKIDGKANQSDLTQEITDRTNADTALGERIDGKQDKLSSAQLNAVNSGITQTKVTGYDTLQGQIDNKADQSALTQEINDRTTADNGLKSEIDGKQDKLSTNQMEAVNSGITQAKVTQYDNYATQFQDKQDKRDEGLQTLSKEVVGAINEVLAKAEQRNVIVISGDTAGNEAFKSDNEQITASSIITPEGETILVSDIPLGTSIYVVETNYPDRWLSNIAEGVGTFNRLSEKIDLSDYYNKGEIDDKLSNKANLQEVNELTGRVSQTENNVRDLQTAVAGHTSSIEALNTNKANTSYVNEQLETKQNTITDLEQIREGANLGKTAVQPTELNNYYTKEDADDKFATITQLNNKADKAELDAHIEDLNNPHQTTKAQVGLGNVDNTSDLNKPISTATQTALNLKADKTYVDTEVGKLTPVIKTIIEHETVNTYEVPTLTVQEVTDLYNAVIAGRTTLIHFDPDSLGITSDFLVEEGSNVINVGIKFMFQDSMILTYTIEEDPQDPTQEVVNITYKEIGGGGGNVPTPPTTGRYKLISNNGIISWEGDEPYWPFGDSEAYINDNGTIRLVSSLVNSKICGTTESITTDDGTTYTRAEFNLPIILSPNLKIISNDFLRGCSSFNKPLTLPNSLTSVGTFFLFNCKNMVSQISIQDLSATIFDNSQNYYTLSTYFDTDPMYQTGIEIVGTNKANFLARFPNSDTQPYRKLK